MSSRSFSQPAVSVFCSFFRLIVFLIVRLLKVRSKFLQAIVIQWVLRYFGTAKGKLMPTVTAPIKVDAQTDEIISHAAHFLGRSKKDIVDVAVREYLDNHRTEIETGVLSALKQLNGDIPAAVSLLTGLTPDQLDDLGGF